MSATQKSGGATLWVAAILSLLLLGVGLAFVWKQATQSLVKNYILENPEIISEAIANLQKKDAAKRLSAAGGRLTKPFAGAVAGATDADVTMVEFTDYSCGYCRKSVEDVGKLVRDDRRLRVVFRELPILSPASQDAARWALAAAKQGKHQAFHDAMFAAGPPNDVSIRAAATKSGLDIARAETDAKGADIRSEIEANLAIMQQIGFNGTPTFVIGDQIIEGAQGYDALKAAIDKARDSKT
jgi:protein-disulfide isomerase